MWSSQMIIRCQVYHIELDHVLTYNQSFSCKDVILRGLKRLCGLIYAVSIIREPRRLLEVLRMMPFILGRSPIETYLGALKLSSNDSEGVDTYRTYALLLYLGYQGKASSEQELRKL